MTATAPLLFSYLPFPITSTTTISPLLLIFLLLIFLYLTPGGPSWALSSSHFHLPGPCGFSPLLAGPRPHHLLSDLARRLRSTRLMAFSIGLTRFVISSHPDTAKEILHGSDFSDRPRKISARELLFHRAMGFAPYGDHWRGLRRIAATHFFSPRKIQCSSVERRRVGLRMVEKIKQAMERDGEVRMREVLQFGSLDSMMTCVFGRSCEGEGVELERMVREGYELLGGFYWGDHVPLLAWLDVGGVKKRCRRLAGAVRECVGGIIDEHRERRRKQAGGRNSGDGDGDFVDVLLGMEEEMGLSQTDTIAVLWELIFRGTDTVAILLEWVLARLVLHRDVQRKARDELETVLGASGRPVSDSDIPNLPYLQSIVKETLRLQPPGPLLSWARLATRDTMVGGHHVPAGTTAMVNMWAIMRDEKNWADPERFRPERFMEGEEVSVMGGDLRIAPFGSGKRVCPGKALGMVSVQLWLAQLVQGFEWGEGAGGVDLGERLRMSMEMEKPLVCRALARASGGS